MKKPGVAVESCLVPASLPKPRSKVFVAARSAGLLLLTLGAAPIITITVYKARAMLDAEATATLPETPPMRGSAAVAIVMGGDARTTTSEHSPAATVSRDARVDTSDEHQDVTSSIGAGPPLPPVEGSPPPRRPDDWQFATTGVASRPPSSPAPPASPTPPAPAVLSSGTAAPEPAAAPPPQQPDATQIAVMVKRGAEFMANGNIGPARMMLEPAAEAGDASAAFALAETYDPFVLERLGTKGGVTANVALARRWYEAAKSLGSAGAPDRLVRLARRSE